MRRISRRRRVRERENIRLRDGPRDGLRGGGARAYARASHLAAPRSLAARPAAHIAFAVGSIILRASRVAACAASCAAHASNAASIGSIDAPASFAACRSAMRERASPTRRDDHAAVWSWSAARETSKCSDETHRETCASNVASHGSEETSAATSAAAESKSATNVSGSSAGWCSRSCPFTGPVTTAEFEPARGGSIASTPTETSRTIFAASAAASTLADSPHTRIVAAATSRSAVAHATAPGLETSLADVA